MFGKAGTPTRRAIRGLMEFELNGLRLDLTNEDIERDLRLHRWTTTAFEKRRVATNG